MTERAHSRRVHYFGGFDPRGAAWYHRLCREEASRPHDDAVQLTVSKRQRQGTWAHVWTVEALRAPDTPPAAHTEVVWMGWDDVIREHWPRNWPALLHGFLSVYLNRTSKIVLQHTARVHRGAFWAGIFPAIILFLGLFLALGIGATVVYNLPTVSGAVAGLASTALTLWAWGKLYTRLRLDWLLRIYLFVLRFGAESLPSLTIRQASWVEDIIQRQQNAPVDEVVLTGHSVGTLVMVDVVDALLRDPRWQALQRERPTLMLTLGQCFTFVALSPRAHRFREALTHLCYHPHLAWCDVTARIDPLCLHEVHPLQDTDTSAHKAPLPRQVSARFFQMYSAERWRTIRRDKLLAHFLYLMAPEKSGNFNLYTWLYGIKPTRDYLQ